MSTTDRNSLPIVAASLDADVDQTAIAIEKIKLAGRVECTNSREEFDKRYPRVLPWKEFPAKFSGNHRAGPPLYVLGWDFPEGEFTRRFTPESTWGNAFADFGAQRSVWKKNLTEKYGKLAIMAVGYLPAPSHHLTIYIAHNRTNQSMVAAEQEDYVETARKCLHMSSPPSWYRSIESTSRSHPVELP